ncbi:response regulator [bacterium]|nr:response regulator [bacterium]MBU1651193.1 response regulator [bacterium]MBU1882435.1 response regulator [bacterium]
MLKILLVEDDPDQILLTQAALEEDMEDLILDICQTGEEALKLDISKYDAILLDYNLPDMNGLDLLERMMPEKTGPVVMITAQEDLELAVHSLKKGADEFIIKSIDLYQILPHVVQRTIANYHWHKNLTEMERSERERKVQIETLKRIMMTLAHHLNNSVLPIIFSAELCQRSDFNTERAQRLVEVCLRETHRINHIINRFEQYVDEEEFKYMDYLDLKDAMFDVQSTEEPV